MAVQQQLYTLEDFAALPDDDNLYELDEGILIIMPPPGYGHGLVAGKFGRLVGNHADEHDLGDVTAAETGFLLGRDPDIIRAPDVAFISKARRSTLTQGYAGAPDLVVEVISPGNTASDINKKIAQFFAAGTRMIWIVYPETRMVYVYRAIDDIKVLTENDTLDGEDVLPGFSVKLRDVFAVLDR